MANSKISELPLATTISQTDVIPIVQGGTTKKATISTAFGGNFFQKFNTNTTQTSNTTQSTAMRQFASLYIGAGNLTNGKIMDVNAIITSLNSNSAWNVELYLSSQATWVIGQPVAYKIAEFSSTAPVFWKHFKRKFWFENNAINGMNFDSSQISDDGSNTGQQPPISSQLFNYVGSWWLIFAVSHATLPIGSVNCELIDVKIY